MPSCQPPAAFRYAFAIALAASQVCYPQTTAPLRINVVEGEGAIQNVSSRMQRQLVVKVEDAAGLPVPRAVVSFVLPSNGPGATFTDGQTTLTAQTGADGIAVAKGLRPNKFEGSYEVRVTAFANGQMARTTINQTNAASSEAAGGSKKKVLLITVLAGAAVGGVLAATQGHKSAAASPTPTQPGIVPGSPSFGPPK